MKPAGLHKNAAIKGDDGFTMVKYIHIAEPEPFHTLMEILGIDKEELSKRKIRHYDSKAIERCFVYYLKDFCADTFGVGSLPLRPVEEDNYTQKVAIYIAFRSKKDLFKFSLKVSCKRTRWWGSALAFTIITTEDDPYVYKKAGEKWNKEDPYGFIRP